MSAHELRNPLWSGGYNRLTKRQGRGFIVGSRTSRSAKGTTHITSRSAESAKGATHISLGQRPRNACASFLSAESAIHVSLRRALGVGLQGSPFESRPQRSPRGLYPVPWAVARQLPG